MKEYKLPSGATLKFNLASFEDSRNLYQVALNDLKGHKYDAQEELDVNFIKDIACTLLASKQVEAALWKCMEKALYDGIKITKETFEPEDARQDYLEVMMHVAWQNILPFGKGLFAQYGHIFQAAKESLKL